MRNRLKSNLTRIGRNAIAIVRLVDYRTILLCLGLTVLCWLLFWAGILRFTKPFLEAAAVIITAVITAGLIGRFAFSRHLFLLWSTGFMAIAMCREIHFTGSDELLLIGWPVMLVAGLWHYDLFKGYLKNPVLVNFLSGGFLLYLISQTIDQRWWRGFPGEDLVHVPLEELMEILGHCTVGLAMLLSRESKNPDTD